MTNTENAGEEIVLDQKEEVLNLRQEEDNSEENNEKPKTKDASSKGENQAEEIEEEVEEEEEEKDKNNVQEIHEVKLQEQQDENEEKEEKDDNEEKDDQKQENSEENENEDNNQKPQEEVNLRIQDNDDDDVKKSDLYLNLQPNLKVKVEWFKKDDDMNIEFSTESKSKVLLHWGVFKNNNTSQWCQPNNQFYPKLTSEPDAFSLNTEFSCLQDDDEQKIFIRLPTDSFDEFNFVFYNQDEDRWHNNFGQDYHIKNE